MVFRFLNLLFLSLSVVSYADCPDWTENEELVPLCPEHGFLGDEYPALAHVISSPAGGKLTGLTKRGRVEETVRKILVYSGNRPPLIYLNIPLEDFEYVKSQVPSAKNLVWINPGDVAANTWVQDSFQSFNDPETGQAVLRLGESYRGESKQTGALLKAVASSCDKIKVGSPLKGFSKTDKCWTGECGGNIEFLPRAGVCVIGDRQLNPNFQRQFCKPEDSVSVPTDWLKVGHVDEFVSLHAVPKTKCDTVIAVASFRKALGLLEANPNELLFETVFSEVMTEKTTEKERLTYRREKLFDEEELFHEFCEWYVQTKGRGEKKLRPKSRFDVSHEEESKEREETESTVDCLKTTSKEFVKYLRNSGLDETNRALQRKFDFAANALKTSLKKKLAPECKVKVVEVPQVFNSATEAISFFPNPTNNISTEGSLILPHPLNKPFREHMEKSFKEAGLSTSFVNSVDDLHVADGNLHCAINTIRYCRGNGKKLEALPRPPPTEDAVPDSIEAHERDLVRHLLGGEEEVKVKTLERLRASADTSVVKLEDKEKLLELLKPALKKPGSALAEAAANLYLSLGAKGQEAISELYEKSSPNNQRQILRAIWWRKGTYPDLAKVVEQGLKSSNGEVAEAALFASNSVELPSSGLMPLLNHREEEVRRMALRVLGGRKALTDKEIAKALKDPSMDVREEAVQFIEAEEIEKEKAQELIQVALQDKNFLVRERAYVSAPYLVSKPEEVMEKAFSETNREAVRAFLYGAGRKGTEEIQVKALVKGINHPDKEIRSTVLKSLESNRETFKPVLSQVFNDSSLVGKEILVENCTLLNLTPLQLTFKGNDPKLFRKGFTRLKRLAEESLIQLRMFELEDEKTLRENAKKANLSEAEIETFLKTVLKQDPF